MKNLAKAINEVAKSIKGIEKSMKVGDGGYSYKGVPDRDVKIIIGRAMQENGLSLLPISIEPKTHIERWEETNTYNGKETIKQKQQVLTEVVTKYLLLHESGESVELAGYGHGVDAQDKSAGKATTYALKYTLLYTFLVATGQIDDADNHHSEEMEVKPSKKKEPELQWLSPGNNTKWNEAVKYLMDGGTIASIKKKYKLRPDDEEKLKLELQTVTA